MTTGTYSIGSETSSFYLKKTWSGTNGKYAGSKLVWNPYSMSGRVGTQVPGYYGGFFYPIGMIWGPSNVNWTSNDTLELLSKLGTACRGHQFNLGVSGGEFPKVVDLACQTLNRFRGAIRSLKRGRFDLALRSLGATPSRSQPHHSFRGAVGPKGREVSNHSPLQISDVSDMWLEIQYGWRPLIQDVYNASEAAGVLSAPSPRQYSVKVAMTKKWPSSTYKNASYTRTTETRTSRQIIAVITENMDASRTLGLQNPAAIAWELTPFSFVADWFIPIGTYLDAASTIPGLAGRYLLTVRTVSRTKGAGVGIPYIGASFICDTTDLARSVEAAFIVPMPQFNNPLESIQLGGRIWNSIALLTSAVSKR